MAGFGKQDLRDPTARSELYAARVTINLRSQCEDTYSYFENEEIKSHLPHGITDQILCVGVNEDKAGACKGDSGAALTIKEYVGNRVSRHVAIGLVAGNPTADANRSCKNRFPDIYTRLDDEQINSWIHSHFHSKDFNVSDCKL